MTARDAAELIPERPAVEGGRRGVSRLPAVVRPKALVCLGATAAKAILGPGFQVTRDRGGLVETELAPLATGTIHPSSILRIEDEDERRLARDELADDLREVARRLAQV